MSALITAIALVVLFNYLVKRNLYSSKDEIHYFSFKKKLLLFFSETIFTAITSLFCLLFAGVYFYNFTISHAFERMVLDTYSFWFTEIKEMVLHSFPTSEIGGFARISLVITLISDYFKWVGIFLVLFTVLSFLPLPGFALGNFIFNETKLNSKILASLKIISVLTVVLFIISRWEGIHWYGYY